MFLRIIAGVDPAYIWVRRRLPCEKEKKKTGGRNPCHLWVDSYDGLLHSEN